MTARLRHMMIGVLLLSALAFQLSPLMAESYAGVAVAGHVPLMQDNSSLTRTKTGYGGEVGGIYEWRKGLFMLQTGVSYALFSSSMRVEDCPLEQAMLDTRGVPFIYRGELRDRTDRMTFGQLTVPLYAGVTWQGWHLMAGVKLAVMLHAQAQIKASLQTVGDYQGRYYDYLEHMPNHGYHDFEPVRSSHSLRLNPVDVRICAETGYTFVLSPFSSRPSPSLRVGAFVEYGLMSMRDMRLGADAPSAVEPDYTHYMSLSMTHLYAAETSQVIKPHLLTFGIRLVLLFPLPGSTHRSCNCY